MCCDLGVKTLSEEEETKEEDKTEEKEEMRLTWHYFHGYMQWFSALDSY